MSCESLKSFLFSPRGCWRSKTVVFKVASAGEGPFAPRRGLIFKVIIVLCVAGSFTTHMFIYSNGYTCRLRKFAFGGRTRRKYV